MRRHIDLFSGIGGFALAAHWSGYQTEVLCERDPFCQQVLSRHWPAIPVISDIRDFDGSAYRGADLLTGGFPCQPFSCAGKRQGDQDDRFLWPEMLRVIREARPAWIVAENVAGIITMALDTVLSDLENEGYATQAFVIPACAVNAPHRRDRVWIVAHCEQSRAGMETHRGSGQGWESAAPLESAVLRQKDRAVSAEGNYANNENVADPQHDGLPRAPHRRDRAWIVAHSTGDRRNKRRTECERLERESSFVVASTPMAHPDRHDQYRRASDVQVGRIGKPGEVERDGFTGRIERSPQPRLGQRHDGLPVRLAGYWDGDWERGIPRIATGIPQRAAKLKALGNAIVPQVAYEILRHLNLTESP